MAKDEVDNRSNQLNPNNDAYYQSRGFDGREDYYGEDDGGGSSFYYSRPSPPPPPSAFEEHVANIRGQVARDMTAEKVGDIVCAYLTNLYPTIDLKNESSARDVKLQVYGCTINSSLADGLMNSVNQWLRNRHWMIKGRIDDVAVVFQE